MGIYADEAISGTSRAKRKDFNRMMEDANNGRMDYIVTKFISRFARNTVDTLNCVRQLRQLNPPVGIYFEKENIDTLDAAGELILTILSALAQDESRSISRWSIQKKFQRGEEMVDLKRILGYDVELIGKAVAFSLACFRERKVMSELAENITVEFLPFLTDCCREMSI